MTPNYIFLLIHLITISVIADRYNKTLKAIVFLNKLSGFPNAKLKKIDKDLKINRKKIKKIKNKGWVVLLILFVIFQMYSLIFMPTDIIFDDFSKKKDDLIIIYQPFVPFLYWICFTLILFIIFWLKGASTLHSQISDKFVVYGSKNINPFS